MDSLSETHLPRGFTFSAATCGLKKSGLDLGLLVSEVPSAAACLFTTNRVKAAPVLVSQMHLRKSRGRMRGIIVNSGNANCATGTEGIAIAATTALKTSWELGRYHPSQILVCSTGVIGVPVPAQKITKAIPGLVRTRRASADAFEQFTRAIMTTDTRPKWASASCAIAGKRVRLLGCAKGAGMIHPQMATMLAFIATDVAVSPNVLRRALREAAAKTFHAITVDGDTSTNDTLAALANGASGAREIRNGSNDYRKFAAALERVCRSLALQIVQDGEGAKRLVEIIVRGAASDRAAERIALTIANSPLVKTAISGADPNWGRILAAAGRAGVSFNPERVEISMAGMCMCSKGSALPFNENVAHRRLLGKQIPISLDLHSGKGLARVWTCDLTEDYVRINASYRS
ncbi:MAG TPA: bifunctional glutamate N-acetyltransferase/amino-acid acetyltransferase ArgJ [Verrucomicrobiae bacterium]|nr:bifunctional glutamate N-acetyltransferase/amino-acid acetyltransferase ArgJ [Verrucomicrobiae bacterium]